MKEEVWVNFGMPERNVEGFMISAKKAAQL